MKRGKEENYPARRGKNVISKEGWGDYQNAQYISLPHRYLHTPGYVALHSDWKQLAVEAAMRISKQEKVYPSQFSG